jgi:hypothetical protein
MTKLVIVLAVVVVVILVVVFVAVRNMRAEDPEEFTDRPPHRGRSRGSQDDRDLRYDSAERQPARASRGSRPAGRPGDGAYRPAAGATRGLDERRERRDDDGYDQRRQGGRGYAEDSDPGQRRSNGDRRRASRPARPEERRRGPKGRPAEAQAPARSGPSRARRSGDSSEWDSSEWEKLSDIDYWTELASDKPLTTTAQPAAQDRPGRPRADREAETATIRTRPTAGAGPGGVDADLGGAVPRAVPRRDPVTGLPVRGRPQPADAEPTVAANGRGELAAAPVPPATAEGQLPPLADPRPPQSRHAGPARAPVRSVAPERRPVDPDDDPLTSPSFPKVPASDSRSYHNGRTNTPSRGSRVPGEHLAPTQEFRSYGSPGPQHAAARHAVSADIGGDTDPTNPNSYLPDPLLNGDPYPAPNGNPYPAPNGNPYPAPNGSPYPAPNGNPYPLPPAPASAASGNPYGSYVTSDGQDTAFSYGDYPAAPGNGHGSYLPAPVPGSTGRHSGSSTGRLSGNGHRQHQQPATARVPGPGTTGYPDDPAQGPAPRDPGAQAADYRNAYGQHDPAGYPPSGYPAGSHNPAGNGLQDPYGRDGYGGYPEYGVTEN